MKRIEVRASDLNGLYSTVNHLYKTGKLTEYMDADIEHNGNIIRFIHDKNKERRSTTYL